MSKRLKVAIAVSVACASTKLAVAADPQPPHGPQTASGRAPTPPQQPARHSADPARSDAAQQFQKNGGSLLRASLASAQLESPDAPQKPHETSFYAIAEPEPRTIRKHDIVNVVVREESSFSSQATTDFKRESAIEAKIDEFIKLKLGNFAIQGAAQGASPPSIKGSANRSFKGEGTQDRTDSLIARMAAEVVDVKPNGTLVLQARKTIKNDDEVQAFVLTGTCRVEDVVAADNSVLSSQLYDLRLEKNTKGTVRAATKRGVIGQVFDFLNPF